MAQITINIPDEYVRDFALYKGYQDQIEDENEELIDNPETELQHAKRILVGGLRNGVRRQRAQTAGNAAAQPHLDTAFGDIN